MKLITRTICGIILLTAIACQKEDQTTPRRGPNTGGGSNPTIPEIDGGKSFLSFDDSASTTWNAHTLEKSYIGNTVFMRATGADETEFELEAVNLTGDSKVPVGNNVGYLLFKDKNGEVFDSRIGGGGNVFYSRIDKERIEGSFLFPLVQSISNNFMELNNGKFGFDLPMNVDFDLDEVLFGFDNYIFIEKPHMNLGGSTYYESGPTTGYSIELTTSEPSQVFTDNLSYSGRAGDSYNYNLNFAALKVAGNYSVTANFKHNDTTDLGQKQVSFYALPIFGTYRLVPLNGAPQNASSVIIEAVPTPINHYYTVKGSMFGKTLLFEDDGTGQIECYDTFQHLGSTVTNIYFYDNGINEIHMAIHSSQFNYFYQLIRL